MREKKQGKRGKRPPSAPGMRLRRVLAQNLLVLMKRDYPLSRHGEKSHAEKALAKDAGISHSSVQRALNEDKGKTLDLVADLAVAFSLKPSQLLDPDLPASPPPAIASGSGPSRSMDPGTLRRNAG